MLSKSSNISNTKPRSFHVNSKAMNISKVEFYAAQTCYPSIPCSKRGDRTSLRFQ